MFKRQSKNIQQLLQLSMTQTGTQDYEQNRHTNRGGQLDETKVKLIRVIQGVGKTTKTAEKRNTTRLLAK